MITAHFTKGVLCSVTWHYQTQNFKFKSLQSTVIKKLNYKLRRWSFSGKPCTSIQSHKLISEQLRLRPSLAHCSPHTNNVCIIVCIRSLVGSLCAFSFHKLHGLLFDCLDALRGAVLLLVLQVPLEEKLDLFHWNTQMDHAIKERPAGERKLENSIKHFYMWS